MKTFNKEVMGECVIKKSRFIAIGRHIGGEADFEAFIADVRGRYSDARHIAYAYRFTLDNQVYQKSSDDGEPSGTAGKPILNIILADDLMDVAVAIVRYFGGIKLGTSGLIVAYKTAAAEALASAHVEERTVGAEVSFWFEYPFMNDVMRIVKEEGSEIVAQGYDTDCSMKLRIRSSLMPKLRARLEKVETLRFEEENL